MYIVIHSTQLVSNIEVTPKRTIQGTKTPNHSKHRRKYDVNILITNTGLNNNSMK